MKKFKRGEKVLFEDTAYDFGYYSQVEGYCVLYYEGERNMQDSIAVPVEKVRKLRSMAKR